MAQKFEGKRRGKRSREVGFAEGANTGSGCGSGRAGRSRKWSGAAVPEEKERGFGKKELTGGPRQSEREREGLRGFPSRAGLLGRWLRAGPVGLVSLFFVLLLFLIFCFLLYCLKK
jgi:hypothetical protein